jgi:hypothetical protein
MSDKMDVNGAAAEFLDSLVGKAQFETLDRSTLRKPIKDAQEAYMREDPNAIDVFNPMIQVF